MVPKIHIKGLIPSQWCYWDVEPLGGGLSGGKLGYWGCAQDWDIPVS
jgi:hypothetical protein